MILPCYVIFVLCSLNDNNISKTNAKLLHKTIMGEKCELNNIKKDSQNLYFKNLLIFWKEMCSPASLKTTDTIANFGLGHLIHCASLGILQSRKRKKKDQKVEENRENKSTVIVQTIYEMYKP